jgi:hypothetical protein
MAKSKKPSELMLDVKEGLIIIDNVLIEHFGIDEGVERAKLCIQCMSRFGNLADVSDEKVYELIVKTVDK